jgi:UDP-N-acetylmuramoyl-tripeptide--D-alanyl-D-alanine ligase
MRMEVLRLPNHVTVINDSYNANPGSMEAALKALAQLPGRSLAVLGEMLELGADSVDAHRRLGERAFSFGVDLLVAVGGVADVVASGAHASGMRAGSVLTCRTHAEAAAAVVARWRPGDVVLIKGSRGAEMERVVALLEEAGKNR